MDEEDRVGFSRSSLPPLWTTWRPSGEEGMTVKSEENSLVDDNEE